MHAIVATAVKICGAPGEPDPLNVMNACLEQGERGLGIFLFLLEWMLTTNAAGTFEGPAPLSPLPPGSLRRVSYVCLIPPETWLRRGLPYSPLATRAKVDVIDLGWEEGEGEEGGGQRRGRREVVYKVQVPLVFGVVLGFDGGGYTNAEPPRNARYVGIVIERTELPASYTAYLADPGLLDQMLRVCGERGSGTYTPAERTITPADVRALRLVERGLATTEPLARPPAREAEEEEEELIAPG